MIRAVGGLDPDVVEAAALAHDLGHPPFGHIAENELCLRVEQHRVIDGFEGNPQSFRIVTKVERRDLNGEIEGLNLTRATLNAILKYPRPRATGGKGQRKWGYYHSEEPDFTRVRLLMPDSADKQSLEAAIMDWADDVAYSVHDVDDCYRAGFIPLDQLLQGSSERDRFLSAAEKECKEVKIDGDWATKFFDRLREQITGDLLEPFDGTLAQRAGLSYLASILTRRYLGVSDPTTTITINPTQESSLVVPDVLKAEVKLLKYMMTYYVYDDPALVAQQYGQRRVVGDLFEIFFDACGEGSKHGSIVPPPFDELARKLNVGPNADVDDQRRLRARLVADIISSMTEQQALLLHHRLTGISPGSILDRIIR